MPEQVTAKLQDLGCRLDWVDVDSLGLPAKGDAVDWLAQHPDATASEVLALPVSTVDEHRPAASMDDRPHVIDPWQRRTTAVSGLAVRRLAGRR